MSSAGYPGTREKPVQARRHDSHDQTMKETINGYENSERLSSTKRTSSGPWTSRCRSTMSFGLLAET